MPIESNRDSIQDSYNDVRSDSSDTNWAVYKYEGKDLVVSGTGVDSQEFRDDLSDDERAYVYLRVHSGDEMSKRKKFMFITWIGQGVSPLKKAKMSTDKAFIKQIISSFAVEVTAESKDELTEEVLKNLIERAGGANYGTGTR